MGCPFGKQRLWIHTRWRVLDGADGHELGAARTACTYGSPLDFGEWFTDAGRARSEVELALAITGRRMAEQMFASNALAECRDQ